MIRDVLLPALLAGVILGFGAGWVVGDRPDRELRAEAYLLAAATDDVIDSCEEVKAENAYLVRMGVGDLVRADALGLLRDLSEPRRKEAPDAEPVSPAAEREAET